MDIEIKNYDKINLKGAFFMRKNRKYNGTFKEMVVKEYLSGQQ